VDVMIIKVIPLLVLQFVTILMIKKFRVLKGVKMI